VFHDASKNYEVCGTEQQKRQKISLDSKHQNVIDYSVLKLPANQFLEYLTLDSHLRVLLLLLTLQPLTMNSRTLSEIIPLSNLVFVIGNHFAVK